MDDSRKIKLDETNNGEITADISKEQPRSLLDPLDKTQLVDLLSKLYVFFFNSNDKKNKYGMRACCFMF